jgi:hypothetical protein
MIFECSKLLEMTPKLKNRKRTSKNTSWYIAFSPPVKPDAIPIAAANADFRGSFRQ